MKEKIYADFNGITNLGDSNYEYIDLCGYGTLASLSYYKIKLENGMEVTLFEPGDIEVDVVIEFISIETDKHNPSGKWFGKFKAGTVKASNTDSEYNQKHLCFKCRHNLKKHLNNVGRQYNEYCPVCKTAIMYPLWPPEKGIQCG